MCTSLFFSWECCLDVWRTKKGGRKKKQQQRINPCSVISDRWCAEDWLVWVPRAVGGHWQTSRPTGAELLYSIGPQAPAPLLLLMEFQQGSNVTFEAVFTPFFPQKSMSSATNGALSGNTKKKNREERSCTLSSEVVWIVFVASWKHIYIFYFSPAILHEVIWANLIMRLAAPQEALSIQTWNEYWWGTGYSPVIRWLRSLLDLCS